MKKYTEMKDIDTFTKRLSGRFWSESKADENFNQTDLRDAFDFMISYENANRFEKPMMEKSKDEALEVLTTFEKFWFDKKDAELKERQEKARLTKELKEKMPKIWNDAILPKFDNVIEELTKFSKMPGFEDPFLNSEIKEQIEKIEKIFKIVPKTKIEYIRVDAATNKVNDQT